MVRSTSIRVREESISQCLVWREQEFRACLVKDLDCILVDQPAQVTIRKKSPRLPCSEAGAP